MARKEVVTFKAETGDVKKGEKVQKVTCALSWNPDDPADCSRMNVLAAAELGRIALQKIRSADSEEERASVTTQWNGLNGKAIQSAFELKSSRGAVLTEDAALGLLAAKFGKSVADIKAMLSK